MAIGKKHALIRENRIGSSDGAAILGLSPFSTAHDVYLRLTKRIESAYDGNDDAYKMLGTMMESPLIDWAAKKEGVKVKKNQFKTLGNLSSQYDAVVVDAPISMEAKATQKADEWGEDGTADVPPYYATQVTHQAAVGNLDLVLMPVCLTGYKKDFRIYRVPVSNDDREQYVEFMENWFQKHIIGDTPPDCAPSLETAWLIKREAGKVAIASPYQQTLVRRWNKAKEIANRVKRYADEKKASILAEMGDAESLDLGDGRIVAVKLVNVKEYTAKARTDKKLVEQKVKESK